MCPIGTNISQHPTVYDVTYFSSVQPFSSLKYSFSSESLAGNKCCRSGLDKCLLELKEAGIASTHTLLDSEGQQASVGAEGDGFASTHTLLLDSDGDSKRTTSK